jgi:1-deoxy-D-xylulose-5-phosphate synthase
MTSGTGLSGFSENFPARFFDVGIAEQHAVTMAAGLAAGGMRPVVALYSTFLQRAYDQLLHDICLQKLPVVLAIDRAGIVGEDGETHQGIYDLSLLLPLPGLEIYCPPDCATLRKVLDYAITAEGPVAIRYPRGNEWSGLLPEPLPSSKSAWPELQRVKRLRAGDRITLAALGSMAGPACEAAGLLATQGIEADVLSITCAKPLDIAMIIASTGRTGHILLIEEALKTGGFGQFALPELLAALPSARFALLGIDDQPLCQGSRDQLLANQKLKPADIAARAKKLLQELN